MNSKLRRRPLTLLTKSGEPSFVKFPLVLLSDETLSANEKLTWAILRHRQGNNESAWPSQERICLDTGLSRATVSRATRALQEAGWLSVWSNYLGKHSSNCYKTHIPEHAWRRMRSNSIANNTDYQNESIDDSSLNAIPSQFDAVIEPPIKPLKQQRESRFAADVENIFQRID